MEGEYDVRAVEAQLAAMAARRAQRGSHDIKGTAKLSHPEGRRPREVVSDFELTTIDSASDSEIDDVSTSSASDGDDAPLGRHKAAARKATLRDSLDLSMSVSVALPAETNVAKDRKADKKVKRPVGDFRATELEIVRDSVVAAPAQPTTSMKTVSVVAVAPREEQIEDLLAGTLVRRRRELERQAERVLAQESSHTKRTDVVSTRDGQEYVQPTRQHRLVPPAVALNLHPQPPLVTSTRSSKLETAHAGQTSGSHLERASLAGVAPTETGTTSKTAGLTRPLQEQPRPQTLVQPVRQGISLQETSQQCPTIRAPVLTNHCHDRIADNRKEGAVTVKVKPSADSCVTSQPALRPPQPVETRQNIAPEKKSNVQGVATAKTVSVPAPAPTTASVSTTTTKPGYARPSPASNQTTPPPVPPAHNKSERKLEPHEDSDDVIDDLLSAEERRLRESLEQLTSRLSTLNAARSELPRKPSSNQSAPQKVPVPDPDKMLRTAQYGGGAQLKLHQPASPNTRSSQAKRSELSGGVHKARVRVGGAIAQETATARTEGGGKHKIVVKKDLAHLLL